jgi:hypothetical protein
MGPSMGLALRSMDFPLLVILGIVGREGERLPTKKVMKQSLSNYAQQDWSDMTKPSTSRHAKASSGKIIHKPTTTTFNNFEETFIQVKVISFIGLHHILRMQLWSIITHVHECHGDSNQYTPCKGKTWQRDVCTVSRTLRTATLHKVPTRSKLLLYTRDEILVPQWALDLAVLLGYLILPPTTNLQ